VEERTARPERRLYRRAGTSPEQNRRLGWSAVGVRSRHVEKVESFAPLQSPSESNRVKCRRFAFGVPHSSLTFASVSIHSVPIHPIFHFNRNTNRDSRFPSIPILSSSPMSPQAISIRDVGPLTSIPLPGDFDMGCSLLAAAATRTHELSSDTSRLGNGPPR
jgi:hypothetical protein